MKAARLIVTIVGLFALVIGAGIIIGCQHPHSHPANATAESYTCPMHPEIVYNTPGKCPKCGMDLTPK